MDIFPPLWIVATSFSLLVAIAGAVGAYHYRMQLSKTDSEQNDRKKQMQQQIVDLSRKLKTTETDLIRKSEFAEEIPLIVSKATQNLPKEAFPPLAVRFAKKFFHATQVGYFVPVEGSFDYTLEVGVGFAPSWENKMRIAANEGIVGLAIQKKVVVAKGDPFSSSGKRSTYPSLEESGIEPDFVAPVIGASGIAGVLVIVGCPFPLDREQVYVSMLMDLFSSALRNATLTDLRESSSWVDPLTGAANRLYFAQRFESEIRHAQNYGKTLALFILDIDEFKKVNDTYGHPAGDQVIKKFAETMRSVTRSSDVISRFGGDEFTVLITSLNRDEVHTYAEHLKERINAAEIFVPRHDAPIRVTASCGVAIYPVNGRSTTELLHAADDALYEAKRQGRNRVIFAQSLALDGSSIDAGDTDRTGNVPEDVDTKNDAKTGADIIAAAKA